MNKGVYGLPIGISFLFLVVVWFYLVIPELESIPSDYSYYEEQIGTNRLSEKIGGPLSEPFVHHNIHTLTLIDNLGENVVLESNLVATTDDGTKFLDERKTYEVNKKLRTNSISDDGFFTFPPHTQKQDYFMTFPLAFTDALFSFDGVDVKHGLEVFRFNCISQPYDITNAIPKFENQPIFSYYTCTIWVEPITGKHIDFQLNWESYYEFDSKKILVEQGGKETTDEYVSILVSDVNREKTFYIFYEQIMPLFFLFVSVFAFLIYFRTRSKGVEEVQKENIILSKNIEELHQIDKMKEEFLSMISHELKTPLTPITLLASALKDEKIMGKLSPKQFDAVDRILRSSKEIAQLIEDMFDAYKLDLKNITYVNDEFKISKLMNEVTQSYEETCSQNGIKLINTTHETGKMIGDTKRIKQVLNNMLNNSIDFVPKIGGEIVINASLQNNSVVFSVRDNGIGISKENQERLFSKFYQVDTSVTRKHGGSGLGLTICHGLITGMRGKIWVESDLGRGTTFYFSLPKNPNDV